MQFDTHDCVLSSNDPSRSQTRPEPPLAPDLGSRSWSQRKQNKTKKVKLKAGFALSCNPSLASLNAVCVASVALICRHGVKQSAKSSGAPWWHLLLLCCHHIYIIRAGEKSCLDAPFGTTMTTFWFIQFFKSFQQVSSLTCRSSLKVCFFFLTDFKYRSLVPAMKTKVMLSNNMIKEAHYAKEHWS